MTAPDQPVELKTYEYYVGHMPIQAQMTAAQAEAMGAKAPGQAVDEPEGQVSNKEAERANTHMKDPDTNGADGADGDALNKARTTRNQRSR